MTRIRTAVVVVAVAIGGCASPPPSSSSTSSKLAPAPPPSQPPAPPKKQGAVTLTILGTNDVHGALDRLPIFAGFVANVRAARAADGGGVLVLDGGDMFQGTLESNLGEGADMIRAYNQIGYAAAAVGNHEFDFGPVGPNATPAAGDDPRGALLARAAEAKFPLVTANIIDQKTGARVAWPNVPASVLIEVAGVKVGIVGASTDSTPHTTMAANFEGLLVPPAGPAIAEEARRLRARGAQVVVVAAHIGSSCKAFDDPDDLSTCNRDEELFAVLEALPKGEKLVDVFVGGHTHQAMAHRIAGVAVIESYASGRAFGRVDLKISPEGQVTIAQIHKPHVMCGTLDKPVPAAACQPGDYEGRPVVPDPAVAQIAREAAERAAARRSEKLGVTLQKPVKRSYGGESALGNLFTDLMLAARPEAQVALTNGGGLRADLPAGELEYGALYEAMPFDNRFAIIDVTGAHLRELVTGNLTRGGAFLSWGGLAAKARCKGDRLDVAITVKGKPLAEKAKYKLVTSDFLASGGDGLIGRLKLPEGSVKLTDVVIRDGMADVLRKRKGALDPDKLYAPPAVRRVDHEGKRPLACGAAAATPPAGGARE